MTKEHTILEQEQVRSSNWEVLQGNMSNKNYLNLLWITKERGIIKLKNMKRSHIQNTLNWCIRKGAGPDDRKDGITYTTWITYFTARLLDPNLE